MALTRLSDIRARSTWADIVEGQPQHLLIAGLLSFGAVALLRDPGDPGDPAMRGILDLSAADWAVVGIALALLHQGIVAVVFRLQLHRNLMTRLFGRADMAVWAAVFMPLLVVRPIAVILVGASDFVPITEHRGVEVALGAVLLTAAIWAMHSTLVHFTLRRALGGDHFREEVASMPKVNKGAFRYTDNAMYGVAFLGLWGIALLFGSWNALVLAWFQQAYIWVHMYCTEAPDMRWIYGRR